MKSHGWTAGVLLKANMDDDYFYLCEKAMLAWNDLDARNKLDWRLGEYSFGDLGVRRYEMWERTY